MSQKQVMVALGRPVSDALIQHGCQVSSSGKTWRTEKSTEKLRLLGFKDDNATYVCSVTL